MSAVGVVTNQWASVVDILYCFIALNQKLS